MRVLFSCQLGEGHWRPLAPLAHATARAGHEVAFATTPFFCKRIAAHGFRTFPIGLDDWLQDHNHHSVRTAEPAQATEVALNVFIPRARQNASTLLQLCQTWRPDLIVREHTEFAGAIVAERLGIPHVAVQISAFRGIKTYQFMIAPLNALREDIGLSPDPELAMLYRYLLLLPFPPRFLDPTAGVPATTRFIRYVSYDGLDSAVPQFPKGWDESETQPRRPTIYASLGTAYSNFPNIFRAILDGLREDSVKLILTSNVIDPNDFGPQPPSVRIERYIPQSLIFPACDLVITHGGSGTVRSAIEHGLPMVVIPIAADQHANARRCVAIGLGRAVEPNQRTAETIGKAARDVLTNPSFRATAQRLAAEMRTLPGPEETVVLLEWLSRTQQPITAM